MLPSSDRWVRSLSSSHAAVTHADIDRFPDLCSRRRRDSLPSFTITVAPHEILCSGDEDQGLRTVARIVPKRHHGIVVLGFRSQRELYGRVSLAARAKGNARTVTDLVWPLLPHRCVPSPCSDLSRFIAAGRLNCSIDRVNGIVETNRPDAKNARYASVIKQGDIVLTSVQRLSRVIG